MLILPPQRIAELRDSLRAELSRLDETPARKVNPVLVTAADVRRHIRQLLEAIRPGLPVISYQELLPEVEIRPLGVLRFSPESP
jgi:type III secretion protein V